MLNALMAFGAAFVLVIAYSLQIGDIADRKWRAIWYEPLIAGAAVLGMGEAISSTEGAIGYILGSTLATTTAIWMRRRRKS